LFVPGLVAFLAAHVSYLRVMLRERPRWPDSRAWVGCGLAGGLMFAFLWSHGLPEDLRAPVAAYVAVLVAMASVAWSLALRQVTQGAGMLALGATLFMLSDSLLAVNRFVSPLPYAGLWVLSTYYAAQAFIVTGLLRSMASPVEAGKQGVW
jgi:uncharacterized membrane protein YhhN